MRMVSRCLSRDELRRFIEIEFELKSYFDDEGYLRDLLENWHCWEIELVLLATTLSQHLERIIKTETEAQPTLRWMSNLLNDTSLTLEGFDDAFVTYMLAQRRQDDTTVEDEMIRIKQLQSERWYR